MSHIVKNNLNTKKIMNYKKIFLFILIALAIVLFAAKHSYFSNTETKNLNENKTNGPIELLAKNQNISVFNIRELNTQELGNKLILLNVYNIQDFNYTFSIELANKLEKIYKNKITIIDIINNNMELSRDTIVNYIIKNNIERPIIHAPNLDFGITTRPNENYFVLINKDSIANDIIYYDTNTEAKVKRDIDKIFENSRKANDGELSDISLEKNKTPESFIKSLNQIRYIRKIADTDETPYFIVSDTKGHKIYIMTIDGKIVKQLGSGYKGNSDGTSLDATFCNPIGLAVEDNKNLYVADFCNNSIRQVNLKTLQVSTLIENNELIKNPIALEIKDQELIISTASKNPLVSYNLKTNELKNIEYQNQGGYIMKLLKYNNRVYFINPKTNILYSLDKDLKEEINFNEMTKSDDLSLDLNNNFYIDETGLYLLDKFGDKVLKINNKKIQTYSDNSSNLYDYPTDIIDVNGKLFILNENNKKIIQLDKTTKNTKIFNIDFGYEYNKVKAGYDEFLNIADTKETTTKNIDVSIELNLEHDYSLEEKAPQTLSLFKEEKTNNTAILVKAYSKREILDNQILQLPAMEENSTYYLKGTFYYCNYDKKTPCLIKKYNKKIIASSLSENKKIIINFLY